MLELIDLKMAVGIFGLNSLAPTSLKGVIVFSAVDSKTCNLFSYQITKLAPITLKEASVCTGGLWGLNRVIQQFQQFLVSKLGKQVGWDQEVFAKLQSTLNPRYASLVKLYEFIY